MSSVDIRAPFFPNSKTGKENIQRSKAANLQRNSMERMQSLNDTSAKDAKVSIPESIRDFSRIKRAVDAAPEIDNSAKIAQLRASIQAGSYEPDYDAIADKMLSTEY